MFRCVSSYAATSIWNVALANAMSPTKRVHSTSDDACRIHFLSSAWMCSSRSTYPVTTKGRKPTTSAWWKVGSSVNQ